MSEVIKGLNLLDVIINVGNKRKKFQAITLQKLESILPPDSDEFKEVRKIILDGFNEYTKSVLRELFGTDFEYIKK